MNTINKSMSTRRFLLTRILGVASLILITVLASIIYFVEAQEKSHIEANTIVWANSLAQASVSYFTDNQKDAQTQLKNKLRQLIKPDYINHIHIYKKKNDDEISYFTGFNKSIYYPSIPDKIDKIEELSSLRYQQNHVELIVKIKQNNRTLGYLYIQSSTQYIADYINQLTLIALPLLLLGLTFFLFLALTIQKKVSQPVISIVDTIQEISQSKNYHARIDKFPLIEFDILAHNINILLERTEKHINKKEDTHQQTLLQNSSLAKKVQARTDALKESNQELLSTLEKLHQFQSQLVETEKMAALGDMVAGVAHEVNTPIGLGVTASTLMKDRLLEVKQAFEDKTLKSSQLKKFLIQGEENLGIIYRNLERAAKLISSFKQVAVDQSSADTRVFDVKELLEEVFITLKSKLNKSHVKLIIDCPEGLTIESKPGPINQILLNLILNSIIHGFEDRDEGSINLSVLYLSNQLHINYKDDGIGIKESLKTKIFEPFTTTKRGRGGSGLGLHLVFNLVTRALNGHIDFESNQGLGTTFDITFPVLLVQNNKS